MLGTLTTVLFIAAIVAVRNTIALRNHLINTLVVITFELARLTRGGAKLLVRVVQAVVLGVAA